MSTIGLFAAMRLFVAEYAIVTLLAEPGSVLGRLPGGEALAWVSLVRRLRRAKGVERQQVKWFTYAAAVLAGSAVLYLLVSEATDVRRFGWFSFVIPRTPTSSPVEPN